MLDSINHMMIKLFCNRIFGVKRQDVAKHVLHC